MKKGDIVEITVPVYKSDRTTSEKRVRGILMFCGKPGGYWDIMLQGDGSNYREREEKITKIGPNVFDFEELGV